MEKSNDHINPGHVLDSLRISGIGVWEWNIQTGEVIYDKTWLEILGFQEGELTPNLKEWEVRIHPEDKNGVLEQVKLFVEQKIDRYHTDHRLLAKDGSYRWVRDVGRIVSFDQDGKPLMALGTHLDITETKELELSYQSQSGQQALMTRVATILNYSNDFQSAVNRALAAIGKFVKVSRIYIFEDSVDLKSTSNTFEWCNAGIEPQIENLQDFPYEFIPAWPRLLDQDGQILASDIIKELPVDVQEVLVPQDIKSILVLPIQYSENQRIGFIGFDQCDQQRNWLDSQVELLKSCAGFLSNAYKRRFSEQELIASRKHYQSLVETQTECIIRINTEGTIRFANNSFCETTGLRNDQAVGHSSFDFVLEDDLDDTLSSLGALGTGREKVFFENRVRTTKGIQWFGWDATLIPLESGDEIQIVGRNITKQRNYLHAIENERKKAEKASEAKSRFVSKVSHELRTPLNSIIGFSDLLSKEDLPSKSRSRVKSILNSSVHLKSMINDLLDFTKIESDTVTIASTVFQIRPMVRDLMNSFQVVLANGVDLSIEVSRSFPASIRFDKTKLWQILNNLIGNSIKFTQEGSIRVILDARKVTEQTFEMYLEVRDTGIGIPKDKLNDVFKSFEQIVYDGSDKYGGTGLGLSIVKAYVELFGGTVHAQSGDGLGTTMTVILPEVTIASEADEGQTELKVKKALPQSSPSGKADIILADDDPVTVKLMLSNLKPYDSSILTAKDGQEAWNLISKNKPDIAILDLDMPKLNGVEVAKKIKQDPALAHINLIAITGLNDILLESGLFSSVLIKPFSNLEILEAIEACLVTKQVEEISTKHLFSLWMSDIRHHTEMENFFSCIYETEAKKAVESRRINHFKELNEALRKGMKLFPTPSLSDLCERFDEAIELFDIVELELILSLFSEYYQQLQIAK